MKRKTIRNHKDFIGLPKLIAARTQYFFIKTKKTKPMMDARYGLVASKRTFRAAVDRNRAKRLLRDWIARYEHLMEPDLDYIFIAYSDILGAERKDGRYAMSKALKRISKYKKQDNV